MISVFWKVESGSELSGVNVWRIGGMDTLVVGVLSRRWPNWQSVAAGSTLVEGSPGNSWWDTRFGVCVDFLWAFFFLVVGTSSDGPLSSESSVRGSSGMIGMGGIGF